MPSKPSQHFHIVQQSRRGASPREDNGVTQALRCAHEMHKRGMKGDRENVRELSGVLPLSFASAIASGNVDDIQKLVLPIVQKDAVIAEWLGRHDVGEWITKLLASLRAELLAQNSVAIASNDQDEVI